jgi:hypothetical protein
MPRGPLGLLSCEAKNSLSMATVSLLVTNYEDLEDAYLHVRIGGIFGTGGILSRQVKEVVGSFLLQNVY